MGIPGGGEVIESSVRYQSPGLIIQVLLIILLVAGCADRRTPPGINVLLITLDTTRADRIGAYGFDGIRTPVIDRLASEGVLFKNAYTSVPLTLPAHCTLMTGLYPPGHGVRNNGNYVLPAETSTIAEILSEKGYATAAFIGSFVLDSQFGLSQGFETYYDSFKGEEKEERGYFAYIERSGGEISDLACDWLESGSSPFFLWLHYYDPHYPYNPPAPFDELYEQPYIGEIAYTDSCLGRVVRKLDEQDLLGRTLIIVTSDHGESLGEHGELSHGHFLYNASIRVPLIMRFPERLPAGVEVDDFVSLADVLPTVCDILDLKIPRAAQGISLMPQIKGEEREGRPIYMETLAPLENFGWSEIIGVLNDNWKYFRVTNPELYNIEDDPGERINLYKKEPSKVSAMESLLRGLESELALDYGETAPSEMDSETRAKLESLGYVWSRTRDAGERVDPKLMVQVINQIDYGMLLVTRGDYSEAVSLFENVLEMDPDNLTAHNYLGSSLYKLGRENEALYHWRKVIDLQPNSIDARRNLARVLKGRGLYEEAAAHFEAVVKLNPEDARSIAELGKIFLETGEREKAESYLLKAVDLDPWLIQPYLVLSQIYQEEGNFEMALGYISEAYDRDSTSVKIREELAKVLRKSGHGQEAVRHLRWLAREKSDAASYIKLGITLDRLGRLEEAVENFREAVKIDSLSLRAYNSMGISLLALKRYDEAEKSFMNALAIRSDYAEPYLNLGNLYRQTGRLGEAEENYRRFLQLWKGREEVRQRVLNLLESLVAESE